MAEQLDPRRGPRSGAVPVETFLRRWMESPMFAGVGPEAAGMEERMPNTGPGWHRASGWPGPAPSCRCGPSSTDWTMPVLVITGEHDAKFTELGRRLVDAVGPNSTLVVVAGTGHAPHLERPGQVAAAVRTHLARARPE